MIYTRYDVIYLWIIFVYEMASRDICEDPKSIIRNNVDLIYFILNMLFSPVLQHNITLHQLNNDVSRKRDTKLNYTTNFLKFYWKCAYFLTFTPRYGIY